MADRGELPGVASRFELFADGDHPSRFGAYALNVLVMSMLYNESPLAYPADVHPMDSQGQDRSAATRSRTSQSPQQPPP